MNFMMCTLKLSKKNYRLTDRHDIILAYIPYACLFAGACID